jgi:polyribonucleotide nucleotidyltransferase
MGKTFKLESQGIEVELGTYARQADGSAWMRHGSNIVLSTAVAAPEVKSFPGFFPLMVEYRERTAAAGRIPGGYIKREGRLSDSEILSSRLIDRPIRPLFPSFYFNELQVLSTVLSADGGFPADILALIGSSLSLAISDIPFLGPIGAVRAARVGGAWKFNASVTETASSDVSITIAGTKDGISMVEGHCNGLQEAELIDLLFAAHELIKEQVNWQLSIQKELGVVKKEPKAKIDWKLWNTKVIEAVEELKVAASMFAADKKERSNQTNLGRDKLFEKFASDVAQGVISNSELGYLFDLALKDLLPEEIAQRGTRIDGRDFRTVRPLDIKTALLPRAHGSAVFQRGETQALVSVTLGTAKDAQKLEDLVSGEQEKAFMLHYNFPPFSTGEVKMLRGASRREIGHGYLAENSFLNVLPSGDAFPYTIRVVSDVLESNGSSSMATVCGTTMALMDAGVPLSDSIAGIAMGLIKDSSNKFYALTDILGTEDALGLMDFKITGTSRGIMAVQMDIKEKDGLTRAVLTSALEQAKEARLFILDAMNQVMKAPRPSISQYAPQVTSFKVDPETIGGIIGPGGKHIKEVIALTSSDIDINDDGTVRIYSNNSDNAALAKKYVKVLSGDIEIGLEFDGKVKRIAEFGLLVELFAGKMGLVHISAIARDKQNSLAKLCPLDSTLKVKVAGYDRETGRIRLVAAALQ